MSTEAISFTRETLRTADRVVFVLSLNLGSEAVAQPFAEGGSNVYRVSTEPITIPTEDGGQIVFQSGLLDIPNLPSETERSGVSDDGPSVPLSVILDGVDIVQLWAQGKRFARARGELAAVTVDHFGNVQQTWETRLRQAEGHLSQPVFGDPESPQGALSFTLESVPYDDVGVILDPRAVIDEVTWSDAPSEIRGKPYPIVVGTPGVYVAPDGTQKKTSGSPAYPVEFDAGDVTTLIISDGEVEADTVRIFDESGQGASYFVSTQIDGRGRAVSVATLTGSAISRTDRQYFACWEDGGGLIDPFTGVALRSLGSVATWLLQKTINRVDYPKWAANVGLLSRVNIDTYFNDLEQSPYEVLLRLLEPLVSVSVRMGIDGLYPLIRRLEISDEDAIFRVEEGPDFQPDGPFTVQTTRSDIRNVFTVLFAPRARTGDLKRSITCTPDPVDGELSEFATEYAVISASRYETTATESIEVPFIYDDGSAAIIASDQVRVRGFGFSTRSYRVSHLYGWIEVGQVLLLGSSYLKDQFVEVVGKRPILDGWVLLLAFDDDPVRNADKRIVST